MTTVNWSDLTVWHSRWKVAQVAAAVLDARDPRLLCQGADRVRLEVDLGKEGDVVEQDGQPAFGGNGLVVTDDRLLIDRVIVRWHHQRAVGAQRLGQAGRLHGLARARLARARDDRHPPGHLVDGDTQCAFLFFIPQNSKLTGGAQDNHAVGLGGQDTSHKLAIRWLVDRFVLQQGGDQDGQDPSKTP